MLNQIGKRIVEARSGSALLNGDELEFISELSVGDAYQLQKNITKEINKKVIGWKLGGTNEKTRQNFKVDKLYWGPVFNGQIVQEKDLTLGRGEVEVALKLSNQVEHLSHQISLAEIGNYIEAIALSVEFPWTVFESFGDAGVLALISDCCASGQCILGEELDFNDSCDQASVKVAVDGNEVEVGSTDNLVDGLLKTLCDFINAAYEENFLLQGGQWVFTGGLTSCRQYNEGSLVQINCNVLPNISFRAP